MGRTVRIISLETLARQLETVCVVINIFSLLLSQVNSMTDFRRKREDPCPKLEVRTSHGCRPCSLCNPDEPNFDPRLVRPACKVKHVDLVIPGGTVKLWCDNPNGPFPECRHLNAEVIRNCSKECKSYGRQFAPGCRCEVGCPGEHIITVTCTRDLRWSNSSNIPAHCLPLSTTTTAITTDFPPKETEIPRDYISWGLGVLFLLVVVIVGAVLFVHCWKKKKKLLSPSSSSASSSDGSEKGGQTDSPLLGSEKSEQRQTIEGERKADSYRNQAVPPLSMSSMSHSSGTIGSSVGQISVDVRDPVAQEHEALLGRGTGEVGETTTSQRALGALLNDREALWRVSHMLDQEDRFDKVTWHTVAKEFAGWEGDRIHNLQFMTRPAPGGCPGEGPMYQVLLDIHQTSRKGLCELITYLANRLHYKHPDVEMFLINFWEHWKQKNVHGNVSG